MSVGMGPAQEPRVDIRQLLQTSFVQAQLAEAELADESGDHDPDDSAPESEPLEAHQLDELADSETFFQEPSVVDVFATAEPRPHPTLADLPYRARPRVRYWIDSEFRVHKLDRIRAHKKQRPDAISAYRDALVHAVAAHLSQHHCQLAQPGDWRHVPAIGSDQDLLDLVNRNRPSAENAENTVPEGTPLPELTSRTHSLSRPLKLFAIELSNGDVVTLQALISPAAKGKRATRAGALRHQADLKEGTESCRQLAGERWEAKDWRRLDRADNAARSRASNSQPPSGP